MKTETIARVKEIAKKQNIINFHDGENWIAHLAHEAPTTVISKHAPYQNNEKGEALALIAFIMMDQHNYMSHSELGELRMAIAENEFSL